MNSRGIPYASDENGNTGHQTTPKTKKPSRFHTGTSLSSDQEIRRAGEQTSPQVTRAVGLTRHGGTTRRVDQWQQINPPFPVSGPSKRAAGQRRKGAKGHQGRNARRQGSNVSRRFRGESQHKVDAKGRVSIPASFRRVLEAGDPNWKSGENPELVIVYGDQSRNFLECYTIEAIEEVDRKIDRMPRGSLKRKALQRLFHGHSFPTNVDETGRLVLPAKLRKKIDLESEALFFATGDTFQIWKPETYAEEEESWAEELPEDFDPMSFLDGDEAG